MSRCFAALHFCVCSPTQLLWRRGIDGLWKRDDFQIYYLNTNGSAGSFQYMKRHQRFEDKTSYYTVVLCLILITTTGTAHCLFSILFCNSGTKEFLRKNMDLFVLLFSPFLFLLIFIFKFFFIQLYYRSFAFLVIINKNNIFLIISFYQRLKKNGRNVPTSFQRTNIIKNINKITVYYFKEYRINITVSRLRIHHESTIVRLHPSSTMHSVMEIEEKITPTNETKRWQIQPELIKMRHIGCLTHECLCRDTIVYRAHTTTA